MQPRGCHLQEECASSVSDMTYYDVDGLCEMMGRCSKEEPNMLCAQEVLHVRFCVLPRQYAYDLGEPKMGMMRAVTCIFCLEKT